MKGAFNVIALILAHRMALGPGGALYLTAGDMLMTELTITQNAALSLGGDNEALRAHYRCILWYVARAGALHP